MTTKYPVGVQSFREIRTGGYLYVDKTEYIYDLATTNKYYFLSRPRRFGKSLLLSTLDAFFSGNRELFDGLAIAGKQWDWTAYPVLHLDLNVRNYIDDESLASMLDRHLGEWENRYNIKCNSSKHEDRLFNLIKLLYEQTGRQVVILIDEYDKPLLHTLHDDRLHNLYRSQLEAFYGVLKSLDDYIKFGMLTGVSRFSKVSIFSGLNNLRDITFDTQFEAVCGITTDELASCFDEGIADMAETYGGAHEQIVRQLKEYYDGYHFSCALTDIYNPFSLLSAFQSRRLSSYWFDTATPGFLIDLIYRKDYNLSGLSGAVRTQTQLTGSNLYLNDPVPVFFQTGYLTIKDSDLMGHAYTLDFPNKEVTRSFMEVIMPLYSPGIDRNIQPVGRLADYVRSGRAEEFMLTLKTFFDGFPYDQIPNLEVHYQNVIYIVAKLLGLDVETERRTSRGRIDLIVTTPHYRFVIKLKLRGTPRKALAQIIDTGYADQFASDTRRQTILIGAAFSPRTRSLSGWAITTAEKRGNYSAIGKWMQNLDHF